MSYRYKTSLGHKQTAGPTPTIDQKIAIDILYQLELLNTASGGEGTLRALRLTTVDAQTDYAAAELEGKTIEFVIYGTLVLTPDEYNYTAPTLSLDLAFPVEGDLRLIVIYS